MKSSNRYRITLGIVLSLALAAVPCGHAQTPQPSPSQVGWSWPAQAAGTGSFGAFGVTGLRYFSVDWVVSGTPSACAFTLDGAVNIGGAFTTGSIIASQNCATSGNFTTTSATENVQAQPSYSITGSGTVTFIVRGYAQNPGTAGSSSSSIISPLDGSGYVEVNCKTGCTPGNPNGQAFMASSAPVVIASNQTVLPSNTSQIGGSNVVADPCLQSTRSTAAINLTASGQLIAGTSGKQTYVCFLQFSLSATADNVALVEGTGSVCATGTAGMAGGSTAATGWNLLASGSVTSGGITSWAFKTATLADNVCLLASSGAQISGVAQYVQF